MMSKLILRHIKACERVFKSVPIAEYVVYALGKQRTVELVKIPIEKEHLRLFLKGSPYKVLYITRK